MDYSKYFWQGKKVRLRPFHKNDAETDYKWMLDSPARQILQIGIELPHSMDKITEFLEKHTDCKDVDGLIIFAIEDLNGNHVGGMSYYNRKRKNGTFTIGLDIYAPYQRNGYGEDAMRILLRYAFHERRYQKCNSGCVHTNEASIALHKKLGFVEEGLRRRNFYFNGRYYDDLLFGLTREEFDEYEKENP
jgi:RimJ/RimL family protein N-acetyltransferase